MYDNVPVWLTDDECVCKPLAVDRRVECVVGLVEDKAVDRRVECVVGLVEDIAVDRRVECVVGLVEDIAVDRRVECVVGLVEDIAVDRRVECVAGLVEDIAIDRRVECVVGLVEDTVGVHVVVSKGGIVVGRALNQIKIQCRFRVPIMRFMAHDFFDTRISFGWSLSPLGFVA